MVKVILLIDCDECGFATKRALMHSIIDVALRSELESIANDESWDLHGHLVLCGLCRPDQEE